MPLPIYPDRPPVIESERPKKILAIAAGKGGVGKSCVTANLAMALAQQNRRVGVLDADVYGPSIRRMLPEKVLPKQEGTLFIPAQCGNLSMMSMAFFIKGEAAAAIRAPIANNIIRQFVSQVIWGPLDYLLIDFPPGTGDIQLTLCQQAPISAALLVTTPQQVAVADVRKALHLFQSLNVPIVGIIENMSYIVHTPSQDLIYPFGRGGGQGLSDETGVPLLGQLPLDPKLSEACDEGSSLFTDSASGTARAFSALAWTIHNRLEEALPPDTKFSTPTVKKWGTHSLKITFPNEPPLYVALHNLQAHCPCAGCVDEETGRRRQSFRPPDPNVRCSSIEAVGNYGIKIQFTSGCCHGIFPYSRLRSSGTTAKTTEALS